MIYVYAYGLDRLNSRTQNVVCFAMHVCGGIQILPNPNMRCNTVIEVPLVNFYSKAKVEVCLYCGCVSTPIADIVHDYRLPEATCQRTHQKLYLVSSAPNDFQPLQQLFYKSTKTTPAQAALDKRAAVVNMPLPNYIFDTVSLSRILQDTNERVKFFPLCLSCVYAGRSVCPRKIAPVSKGTQPVAPFVEQLNRAVNRDVIAVAAVAATAAIAAIAQAAPPVRARIVAVPPRAQPVAVPQVEPLIAAAMDAVPVFAAAQIARIRKSSKRHESDSESDGDYGSGTETEEDEDEKSRYENNNNTNIDINEAVVEWELEDDDDINHEFHRKRKAIEVEQIPSAVLDPANVLKGKRRGIHRTRTH